jgi:hypothetical protein
MASTHKSLRSSTADKRPTTAIADGQIALNTNATSPGLFFKDSTGASIIKVGPVHVGSTAPNVSPAVGGSSGNSTGEVWLDNSLTPVGVKIWNGSAWVNATPAGSTTVQGLLELATDAETQAGSDTARAVTPASLQSKVSDSTSTTSSTTIASSTAVKSAYDLAAASLPASGGTVTGNLEIGNTGSLSFEGATANGFETTIAVTDPTADRTITLPDTSGTVVTTGDTGTVTSTMLLDGTIVNGDINASAAIAGTKISPDFGSQTITTTGVVSAALGAAATPSITFTGDLNTGIYSPGADQVAISTNAVERVEFGTGEVVFNDGGENYDFRIEGDTNANLFFVDASTDRVGLGTSSPSYRLHVDGGTGISTPQAYFGSSSGYWTFTNAGNPTSRVLLQAFNSSAEEKIRFDTNSVSYINGGNVGIGTTSPTAELHVVDSTSPTTITSEATANSSRGLFYAASKDSSGNAVTALFGTYGDGPLVVLGSTSNHDLRFITNNTEKARIDSSGRLLVGTSTSRTVANNTSQFQLEGTSYQSISVTSNVNNTAGAYLFLSKSRGTANGSNTVVQSGDTLGGVYFIGAGGSDTHYGGAIQCQVDGTPGANDMPGRLVFSTTADGAATPTERMRIGSDGNIYFGKTTTSTTVNGIFFQDVGSSETTAVAVFTNTEASDAVANIICNRQNSDGRLVQFRQANTTEGTISVSGTTVTYGGGHLARWSQLPNEENPADILKGTVMSNLDEMCEWGEENNEQLNKTKVSDVEGDPNVAGVFVSTSFDEDGPLDFFVAMTGDMIIRIAEGVTVQRGNLLMSAGDGTAKPQDDDIIRSKTIAKVTSTHVTCTYDDGSYCVPCVLMAC